MKNNLFKLYDNTCSMKEEIEKDSNIENQRLSEEIYKQRKHLLISSEDILNELKTNREEIKPAIVQKRYVKALKIMNAVCFKYMMPKSALDETRLTPYNTSIIERYTLNGYLNVSEITLENQKYFATQIPHLDNLDQLVNLLINSQTRTIISCVKSKNHLSSFKCCSSELVVYKKEVLYFNESYLIGNELIKVYRFNSWEDYTVISKDKLEFFYSSCGGILQYPVLVHCRAGVGRTGFFIMYDYLRKKNFVTVDEFLDILFKMRSFTSGLVWTPEQLSYLIELFVCG